MVTSRIFPAASPPTFVSYTTTPFTSGISFRCIGPKIQWLMGYYIAVPTGGDTNPVGGYKCALYQGLTATTGTLITGSQVTSSGALVANSWNNFVPLASPIPLALDTPWKAAMGWQPSLGFPDTSNQFGSGQPFAAGITSGDIFAYSDQTGSAANPDGSPQGGFSTSAIPAYPDSSSNSGNFGIDVLLSDTAPAGYTGNYSLFPNNQNGNLSVTVDLNVPYNVGTEFALSVACPVEGIGYYSPPGSTGGLATRASIFSIASGGLVRNELYAIASPSWSGAAGSGWVQANFSSPPVLPAGKYVSTVYNANGATGGWNAKDSVTGAFATGNYQFGISNGPLSAPNQSSASLCYDYNAADGGSTPPYSAGTTEAGQCPFGQLPSGAIGSPYLYAGLASGSTPQNYFVTPIIGQPVAAAAVVSGSGGDENRTSAGRKLRYFL